MSISGVIACLFLLTEDTPVFGYDAELWTHYTSQNIVTDIAEGESEIYFATSGGIRRYERFRQAWLRPITTADGLPDNWVQQLSYNRTSGDLSIRTKTGAATWMSRLESLSPGGIAELSPTRYTPRIPTVIPPFGYYINGDIIRGPGRNYRILDALVDSWNILWIATEGLGIGRVDLSFGDMVFLQSGPLVQNVTALNLDGRYLWAGGADGFRVYARGISRYDRDTEQWEYYEERVIPRLEDTEVNAILADTANVWFGTDQGLVRYSKSNETWDTYRYRRGVSTQHIRHTTSLAAGDSRVWLGTNRGLALLDLESDTLRAVPGSGRFRIRDLATGSSYVWAATNKGLYRSRTTRVSWEPVRDHPVATQAFLAVDTSGDTTWALATVPPNLMVSTHPDSVWRVLKLPEAAGSVTATLSGAGERAWIGTEFGVIRVNTRSGRTSTLNQIDGLLDDVVQAIELEGPHVWIGTRGGLSRYHWANDFRDPKD